MKARFAADAPRGLLADDKNTVRLREDAHGRGIDARHVNRDLERIVGFVHVERGRAFADEGFRAEQAAELEEDAADLLGEIAELGRDRDRLDA